MCTELVDLFAGYERYIRRSQDVDSECNAAPPCKFSEGLWGETLTFEEFKIRWKRICKDPALERLWQQRLHAGREHETRAVGQIVDRLALAATKEDNAAA